jgi:hypothetical protein
MKTLAGKENWPATLFNALWRNQPPVDSLTVWRYFEAQVARSAEAGRPLIVARFQIYQSFKRLFMPIQQLSKALDASPTEREVIAKTALQPADMATISNNSV